MALFSAAEDFSRRTLAAVPGLLAKMRYVSGLRRDDGQYAHWGLSREYGDEVARRAIEGIHRELTLQVLRTPLRDLVEDAIQAAQNADTDVTDYVAQLNAESGRLLPDRLVGGSVRHFSTILQALSGLARSYKAANRRVS